MPNVAKPKGGDLPVFPAASQYAGSNVVNTMRPSDASRHHEQTQAQAQARQQQAYRQQQQYQLQQDQSRDPRHASRQHPFPPERQRPQEQYAARPQVQQRVPSGPSHQPTQQRPIPQQQYGKSNHDLRSGVPIDELNRLSLASNHSNSSNRPPVLGIQAQARNRTASPNTMMAGQAFGLAPDNPRAPPYDPVLWNIFCQVDADGSGGVTAKELSHALINGDFTNFHLDTVALMIKLFDEDRNGTISFPEFEKLWKYLLEWKTLFMRFDVDHSGTISFQEFSESLVAFGYRLSTSFVQFLFRYHDKDRKKEMSFDLFVQSCVTLRMFTDVFKTFDDDQDGVITIGFEDFLKAMIRSR